MSAIRTSQFAERQSFVVVLRRLVVRMPAMRRDTEAVFDLSGLGRGL